LDNIGSTPVYQSAPSDVFRGGKAARVGAAAGVGAIGGKRPVGGWLLLGLALPVAG
jgi:hypothetical protein